MTDDREPPTCGGEPMEWNVMARRWECSCGRDVAAGFLNESAVEVRAFEHCPPRYRPLHMVDAATAQAVWDAMFTTGSDIAPIDLPACSDPIMPDRLPPAGAEPWPPGTWKP